MMMVRLLLIIPRFATTKKRIRLDNIEEIYLLLYDALVPCFIES
jgi:hypothetical protein